ncbi:hypothetical protein HDU98_005923 [Podochytrium sp. JEL0797]|nr:hypothetical protein HDU98_005923 [Podochytrium sp. JEL0797]
MPTSATQPPFQHAISLVILGLIVESNIRGIVSALRKLHTSRHKPNANLLLILTCNVASLGIVCASIALEAVTQGTCVPIWQTLNVFYHLFFVAFDIFLLYKTHVVFCSKSTLQYKFWSAVILANRIAWALADLVASKGVWNPDAEMQCSFQKNLVSGPGYLISDIILDVLCTLAILYTAFGYACEMNRLWRVLILENVIRSFIVLIVQCILTWVILTKNKDMNLVFSLSLYTYSHILNSEFYWRKARQAAIVKDGEKLELESF